MDWAGLAAELFWHFRKNFHEGGGVWIIHFRGFRMEHQRGAVLFQKGTVPLKVSGIGLQILVGTKLGRIYEIRHNDAVTHGDRLVHKACMSLMQVTHGGNEPNRKSFFFPLADGLPDLCLCICTDHYCLPSPVSRSSFS